MKQYVSRIMEHGPRSTLAGSRRRDRMCVRFGKCVYGLFCVPYTHNSFYYHTLTSIYVMCVMISSFFRLSGRFLKTPLLFYKSYFNLKTHYTHYTHSTAPVFAHFLHQNTVHTFVHTPYTHPLFSTHMFHEPCSTSYLRPLCPLTVSRKP